MESYTEHLVMMSDEYVPIVRIGLHHLRCRTILKLTKATSSRGISCARQTEEAAKDDQATKKSSSGNTLPSGP